MKEGCRERKRKQKVSETEEGKFTNLEQLSKVLIWCCSASPPGVSQVDGLPPAANHQVDPGTAEIYDIGTQTSLIIVIALRLLDLLTRTLI